MRILLLTAMVIFASSASAGLYKWVDEEGNIHYSQKRPPNQQYEKLKAPAPVTEISQPLYKTKTTDSKVSDITAAETAKNNEIRARNCTAAKRKLNTYQVYRRLRDKDGNVTRIDDNERTKQIKSAKQSISDFCE